MSENSAYRSIFKATSLFGGVQMIQIVISLLRGKFIAILLGATGMGISALFTSTITMLVTLFGLGLNTSAVRDISGAYAKDEKEEVGRMIIVFRTITRYCALIGILFICITSPLLSYFTFKGSYQYTYSFIGLSLLFAATLFTQQNNAILQGIRRLKDTAQNTLYGALSSLCISVPLYYFFQLNAIVPALVLSGAAAYFISHHFVKKAQIPQQVVTNREVIDKGKGMVKLGATLILTQFINQLCIYLTNNYIGSSGNLEDVGYYQAALTMTYHSVSLVFASMAADYFPRLVSVCENKEKMNKTVNQQGEIVLLIAVPLLLFFIVFSPFLIYLLLAPEFYVISDFIRIISLGMLFKTISYAIGYISFAKGDKKVFLFLEGIFSNLLQLVLSIIGYTWGGLEGLSIAFVVEYLLYLIVVSLVVRYRYHFRIQTSYFRMIIMVTILSCFTLFLSFSPNSFIVYGGGSLLVLFATLYSLYGLNKRLELVKSIA